jgi:hypothetical protein
MGFSHVIFLYASNIIRQQEYVIFLGTAEVIIFFMLKNWQMIVWFPLVSVFFCSILFNIVM